MWQPLKPGIEATVHTGSLIPGGTKVSHTNLLGTLNDMPKDSVLLLYRGLYKAALLFPYLLVEPK